MLNELVKRYRLDGEGIIGEKKREDECSMITLVAVVSSIRSSQPATMPDHYTCLMPWPIITYMLKKT